MHRRHLFLGAGLVLALALLTLGPWLHGQPTPTAPALAPGPRGAQASREKSDAGASTRRRG